MSGRRYDVEVVFALKQAQSEMPPCCWRVLAARVLALADLEGGDVRMEHLLCAMAELEEAKR